VKHTQGPWKVNVIYGTRYINNKEIQANARLIAAAPELLDALKKAEILLSAYGSGEISLMIEIRRVIVKAEGIE
jgi:hypothetical protein